MVNGFTLKSREDSKFIHLAERRKIGINLLLQTWLKVQVCLVVVWRYRYVVRECGVNKEQR